MNDSSTKTNKSANVSILLPINKSDNQPIHQEGLLSCLPEICFRDIQQITNFVHINFEIRYFDVEFEIFVHTEGKREIGWKGTWPGRDCKGNSVQNAEVF